MTSTDPEKGRTDEHTPRQRRFVTVVGTSAGNALEWFDWSIYPIFAPFFASQFFASKDSVTSVLSALLVFAVGFLARPVGGFVFGWVGDRLGRRTSMLLAISVASTGSIVIGIAPTHANVGILATILLVLARLCQGLAHGGEVGASNTYIAEMAPTRHRGLWASSIYVSGTSAVLLGTLVGATLTSALDKQQMETWGWRIPFIAAGVLGAGAIIVRAKLSESEVFEKVKQGQDKTKKPSLLRGLWESRKAALRLVGIIVGATVFYQTWTVTAPTIAISSRGMDASGSLWAGVVADTVLIVVLPIAGALSDRFGRRPTLLTFYVGAAILSYPLNWLIQGEIWQLMLAMSIASVLVSLVVSQVPAVYAELFPARVRASGIGLTSSVAVALTGGTAPYLQTFLNTVNAPGLFTVYSIALLVLGFYVAVKMPETRGKSLHF